MDTFVYRKDQPNTSPKPVKNLGWIYRALCQRGVWAERVVLHISAPVNADKYDFRLEIELNDGRVFSTRYGSHEVFNDSLARWRNLQGVPVIYVLPERDTL